MTVKISIINKVTLSIFLFFILYYDIFYSNPFFYKIKDY